MLLDDERNRQASVLNLVASENYASDKVLAMLGSEFTNKYAEGYPGVRYYGGCTVIDDLERYTVQLAQSVFGMPYANVQPHSGAQANLAVYHALVPKGGTILALGLNDGGHLTHGSKVSVSSQHYNFVHYHVKKHGSEFYIDMDEVEQLVKEHKPTIVIAGGSSCVAPIDYEKFKEVSGNAIFMVDAAHIAGFMAAGWFPQIAKYADVVTMTTQKTLRGPRGGLILSKEESIAQAIDKAVFPGIQGGPHMNVIAAKAAALEEASTPEFMEYQEKVKSIRDWVASLIVDYEYVYTCDSMPHMMVIDTWNGYGMTGKDAQERLERAGIIVNKQMLPDDKLSPKVTSGIRLGFSAVVTRHMRRPDTSVSFPGDTIASTINEILRADNRHKAPDECGKVALIREYVDSITDWNAMPKWGGN